jgi:hypothetical protein
MRVYRESEAKKVGVIKKEKEKNRVIGSYRVKREREMFTLS